MAVPPPTQQHQPAQRRQWPELPTAAKALETLVQLGIAREIAGGQRNRLFAYDAYLAILSEGAEPL